MLPWLHPSRQKIALPCKMDGDCPFFSVACWARAKEVMQRTERVIARNSVPRVRYRHFVLQPQTFCVKSFLGKPQCLQKKALSTSAYQHMRCNKCAGKKTARCKWFHCCTNTLLCKMLLFSENPPVYLPLPHVRIARGACFNKVIGQKPAHVHTVFLGPSS